ncbi:DUF4232 domain-containing protein [Actinomadura sp. LD22]|uniref:DUF4232 domain-containing protein n=1 Tax=Actinomadura physcomitrii TaxID=2650748 RepID=A0A6I4MJB6_9ACTN|nr:DUF4232 domain-containing protein [Actinomadura physcomitrii]MWA06278.1 DUF4232 domain-containing protein [Actinomadura physcomitrii]
MQRIIWGTLAAAALAAALTGCDASFSASPSSSTENAGSSHSSAPAGGSGTSTTSGSGTGARPHGASGTRHCTTSDLHASAYANGDPGAGQRYGTLQLTNNSGTACTTGGWSGLGLVNASGALPTKVVREGTARTITIPAGASAYEQLHWGVIPGDGDDQGAQCQPTARALHIIPPNQTTHLSVNWIGGPVCQQGQIRLTPIKLGKM